MKHSALTAKIHQQVRALMPGIQSVILGLSGGADSVALLYVLRNIGVRVRAVHCNFHLRGAESDRDMNFCIELCRGLDVTLDIVHFDVPAYQAAHNVSLEVACRELRYEYFHRMLQETGFDRIAVAHHADDNIETLFLNLLRGCGIDGLRGMLPDANNVVRPLLHVTRAEILQYLDVIGQAYVTDSTNLQSDYRRNFIRNELLPLIETQWTGARKAITSTISNLRSDSEALDMLGARELDSLQDQSVLPYRVLKESAAPQWLLHKWLTRYGTKSNISREIMAAFAAGRPQTGKQWCVRDGIIRATRTALQFTATGGAVSPAPVSCF